MRRRACSGVICLLRTTFCSSAFSSFSLNAITIEVAASVGDADDLLVSITFRALRRHFSTALNVGDFFQGKIWKSIANAAAAQITAKLLRILRAALDDET